jgi:hypothetical protein
MTKPTTPPIPSENNASESEGFRELLRRLGNIERRYGIPLTRWNIAVLCYLDQQFNYDIWKIIVYASIILFRSGAFIEYSLKSNKLLFLEDDIMDDEQQHLAWNQNVDEQTKIREQNLINAALSLSVKIIYDNDSNLNVYLHGCTTNNSTTTISIPEMEYELCFKAHWRLFISQELYDDESMMLCW